MVKYSLRQENKKTYIREISFYQISNLIMLWGIFCFFAVLFLISGILSKDKKELNYGISSIVSVVFFAIVLIYLYLRNNRILNKFFFETNDDIKYELALSNNKIYRVKDLTKDNFVEFSKNEVKKFAKTKNLIIITLINKSCLFMLKTDEVERFLEELN